MSIPLLVTIILMVLILAIGVGLWSRHHRIRPIVGAVGLALIPLGLWLFGITDLAVNGIKSIIDWAQGTVWNDQLTLGAALAGGGLLAFIVSLFLPKGPKPVTERPAAKPVGGGATPQVGAGRQAGKQAAQPAKGAPAAKPAAGAKTGKDGLTDEDREIQELLRRRGIG